MIGLLIATSTVIGMAIYMLAILLSPTIEGALAGILLGAGTGGLVLGISMGMLM